MPNPMAAIVGLAGTELTANEKHFIRRYNPYGFILFKRNCQSPQQIKKLTRELRDATGRSDTPILIDQEGGRVARLRGDGYASLPPMQVFGDMYKKDKTRARRALTVNVKIIAAELLALGIDVDCIPVLDVPVRGADNIIGDRAFARDPHVVADLGEVAVAAALSAGLMPIIKHIPGHGRAMCDSHLDLPVVKTPIKKLWETDFLPFRQLHHAPWAMLAHVVYSAIDPVMPASLSPIVIDYIRHNIKYDGVLIGDDLSMKALRGSYARRTQRSIDAGADLVLHCNGNMAQMEKVASACPPISALSMRRLTRAKRMRAKPAAVHIPELLALRRRLLLKDS